MELTQQQKDMIILALENDIESNEDWISDEVKGSNEVKGWKRIIVEQKKIIKLLKGTTNEN